MSEQPNNPPQTDAELKQWCIVQAVEVQKASPNTDVLTMAQALHAWVTGKGPE